MSKSLLLWESYIWVDRVRCRPTFNYFFLDGHPAVLSPLTTSSSSHRDLWVECPDPAVFRSDSPHLVVLSAPTLSSHWLVRGVGFLCLCSLGPGLSCWRTPTWWGPRAEEGWSLPVGLWGWLSRPLRNSPCSLSPPHSQPYGQRVLSPPVWLPVSC